MSFRARRMSFSSGSRPSAFPVLGSDGGGGVLPSPRLLEMLSDMMTADAIFGATDEAGGSFSSSGTVMITIGGPPPPPVQPPTKIVFESYKPSEEKWQDVHTKTKCKICMDDEKVVQCVFEPCGHACACRSCAEKTLKLRGSCPICNIKTTGCFKYRKQILVQDDEDEEDEERGEKGCQRGNGGEKKRTKRK